MNMEMKKKRQGQTLYLDCLLNMKFEFVDHTKCYINEAPTQIYRIYCHGYNSLLKQ